MATWSGNLDARTPSLLYETDAPDWNDISVEYFSNLTRYLKNITISLSRPRISDLISVDSDSGLEWLIAIPVAYFVVVGLILGVLLVCFWYVDRSGGVSASHSEASGSTTSSVKEDNGLRNMKHDTLVVNEAHHLPHQSSVRSYLINTEFQDILRLSDGSKGSTRSLGVLTEKDLHVSPKLTTSKSPDFTPTGRRQSMNIQACHNHIVGVSDRKVDSRTFTRVKSKFPTALRSGMDIKLTDGSVSSRNISSFSTDSLDERVSADCLGASMELHKEVKAASGEIGPGDLYGCRRYVQNSTDRGFVHDTAHCAFVEEATDRRFVEDVNINHNTESKMDRKFIFLNHIFTDKRLRDIDSHLKESYEAAVKADKMNFYYANSKDSRSPSFFPSIHFPGHEHSQYGRPEEHEHSQYRRPEGHEHSQNRRPDLTPFPNAYTLNYENSNVLCEARHEHLVKNMGTNCQNMGTNCQNMNFGSYITTHSDTKEHSDGNIKTRLFTSGNSVTNSQMSSAFFTDEDTRSSNDRQRTTLNDISLVSLVLSDKHGLTPSSGHQKEDFQAPDVDVPDFDISSVSQIAMSSQGGFDNSQESFGSGGVRPNEGSFCSPNNSLPSSIARFHASNLGQWPSPCAAYSLPSETDLESNPNECPCKECHGKGNSRSSLSVNFGSFSESTTAESRTALSHDNSQHLSQNGTDCFPGSNKVDPVLVKLSKRPSPLSSFVNNIKQRYSFDDNCLKLKRDVSDEEEALLSSPLPQREFGTKFNKQSSLDSKRRKVSAEERLHEYGFLKCKGKKYVINPSPGKYETGAGYYNLVFTNNEEVFEMPNNRRDSNTQIASSQVHFATNGSMDDGSFAGVSEGISKSPFSQPPQFASDYQYSPFMEDSFHTFTRSRFNQREEFAVTETCSDMEQEDIAVFDREAIAVNTSPGQDSNSVFEAHCGDDSVLSDIDFTQAESRNNQKAKEIGRSLSSFPDHGVSNTFEKQNNNLIEPEKKSQRARLFSSDFVSPGNEELPCAGLPKMKTQTAICEQIEGETYESSRSDMYGKGQNGTYGKGQNGTYGKGQNYMHEISQRYENNDTRCYENSQRYENNDSRCYENSQRYENNDTGCYEKAPNGKCDQTQIDQPNNSQQYVNKDIKLAKISSSDFSDTDSNSIREGKYVSSKTSVGKVPVGAEHKLKRQQASRTLLALENAFSLRDMQQDRDNGFSLRDTQQDRENAFSGHFAKVQDRENGVSRYCEIQQDREYGFSGREMQQDRENGVSRYCEIQEDREYRFSGRQMQQARENGVSRQCEIQQDRETDFSGGDMQQDRENGFSRRCEMQQNRENGVSGREKQPDRNNGFSGRFGIQQGPENGFSRHFEKQQDRENGFSGRETKQNPESELQSRSRLYRPTKGHLQATKVLDIARF